MKRVVGILSACLLAVVAPAKAAEKTCEQLWQVSARQMATTRESNRRIPTESRADENRRVKNALAAARKNRWPFESPPGTDTFIFAPADIDGDGKTDRIESECGAPTHQRVCLMKLTLAGGKTFEQQAGFLYIVKVNHRFYAVWDHYEPEARLVKDSFSRYYKLGGRGFTQVCETAVARRY